jgi:hypothetical protein
MTNLRNKSNPLDSLPKASATVRQAIDTIPAIGAVKVEEPAVREDITLINDPSLVEIRKELFDIWNSAYKVALENVGRTGLCTLTDARNREASKKQLEKCKIFADLCLEDYIETRRNTVSLINDYVDSVFKGV